MNLTHLWLLLPFIFVAHPVFSQDSNTDKNDSLGAHNSTNITSASGFGKNATGSISFSVGLLSEVLIIEDIDQVPTTAIPTDSIAFEDDITFEDAYAPEDAIAVGKATTGTELDIDVAPNPVINYLHIDIKNFTTKKKVKYYFTLFDSAGMERSSGRITNGKKQLAFHSMPKGIYFLILFKNGKEIKSFKLLKNNP